MLLKESPDTIYDFINPVTGEKENVYYMRDDAFSFLMFEDGFTVYAKSSKDEEFYGHSQLTSAFLASQKALVDYSSLSSYEKHLFDKNYVKTLGEPSEKTKSMMLDTYSFYGDTQSVIRGRFWTNSKVLSYWNTPLIKKRKLRNKIIQLIKTVGEDPTEYKYEVEAYDFTSKFVSMTAFLTLAENDEDKEQHEKEYFLKNKTYTSSELNDLRTAVHLKTGYEKEFAISTLCMILDKEALQTYPELKGFLPADCSKVKDPEDQVKSALSQAKPDFRIGLRKSIGPDRRRRSVTISPSDELGKLPGALPFRAKTQKELDRAWDISQKNKASSFKEWLYILENLF